MKLSEAIMLGSLNTLPGSGPGSISGYPTRCALGAALHAVGYEGHQPYTDIYKIWPWTSRPVLVCPATGKPNAEHSLPMTVATQIWLLNDTHHWTRPQIAEWVASVEPTEARVEECQVASHLSKS